MHRHPGDEGARPREGTIRRFPLAEFCDDTCFFAGNTEGGGVGVARPREVRWRSKEPVPRGAYSNRKSIQDVKRLTPTLAYYVITV